MLYRNNILRETIALNKFRAYCTESAPFKISGKPPRFMYSSSKPFSFPISAVAIGEDLHEQFAQISALIKKRREELYRMLVEEAKYFG